MEYNIEKKCIGITQIIKEELQEQPLEAEWNLPDYCSDIERILKCRGEVRISTRRVTGRTAYLEGYTAVTLIYADSNKCISSYEQAIPFYCEIPLDNDRVKRIDAEGALEYLNCRATSPKRVEVKGAIGLKIYFCSQESAEIVVNAQGEGIETDRHKHQITSVLGVFEKYMTVSDEVEITDGNLPLRSIISGCATLCDLDVNPITDKVIVKGNLRVKMIYCGQKGNVRTLESTIPFNQIIDTEGSTELCQTDLKGQVTSLDLRPRTGVDGESRAVGVTAGLLLSVRVEETVECDLVENAYSTKYKAELTSCPVGLYSFKSDISKKITVQEEVELSAITEQIFDVWCDQNNTFRGQDEVFSLNGNGVISILLSDSEGNPRYIERDVNYNFRSEIPATQNDMCIYTARILDVGYTLKSNTSAEVRMTVEIDAKIYEQLKAIPLSNIVLDEDSPQKSQVGRSPIIVYYRSKEETLFEIAARYNTSVSAVRMANDIEEGDTLGNVLLIPIQN